MAWFQPGIRRFLARKTASWLLAVDGFVVRACTGTGVKARTFAVALSVFLLGTSSMLLHLGRPEVCGFNEAVEGVALQGMVEHGSLLFPLLNGHDPMYKPPLFHWTGTALAALMEVHQVTEFTLRLPSVVYALAGVFLTMTFVYTRFSRHAALLSGLVLLASYQYVQQSRVGRVDMTLTFFETLALFSFLWWLPERGTERNRQARQASGQTQRLIWHYALALALACAVLAKGPVGALLPLLTMTVFLASERRWADLRALCKPGPTAVFVAVGASWYLACCFGQEGAFLTRQLGGENFGRYFGRLGRMPPWYYLKPLLLNSVPFSLLVPPAVYAGLRWRRRSTTNPPGVSSPSGDLTAKMLALFWLLTVLFFSTAAYKRRAYLLPLWPAAAVLLVWWLQTSARERRGKILRGAVTVSCVVLPVVNLVYIPRHEAAACAARPYREAAAAISRIVGNDDELYIYGADAPMSLVFYLGRTIRPFSGKLADLPAGYMLVPSELWARKGKEAPSFEKRLTQAVGEKDLALVQRRTALHRPETVPRTWMSPEHWKDRYVHAPHLKEGTLNTRGPHRRSNHASPYDFPRRINLLFM